MSFVCNLNRTMVDYFIKILWENHGRLFIARESRCADWYQIDSKSVLN